MVECGYVQVWIGQVDRFCGEGIFCATVADAARTLRRQTYGAGRSATRGSVQNDLEGVSSDSIGEAVCCGFVVVVGIYKLTGRQPGFLGWRKGVG